MSFVCTSWRCPGEIHNQPLNAEHKEGPQPGDSGLVGGRRNKQGNLPTRLISALPTRLLKGLIEPLMQFSHIQTPGDLNKTLFSQDLLFFLWVCFCFVDVFICVIRHLSFFCWITLLSMVIYRSIHVAASDIISFFLWLSSNGNPLQCSRLENPMDGGAWWAAVHGVAQSRTQLKRLSSSSSSSSIP